MGVTPAAQLPEGHHSRLPPASGKRAREPGRGPCPHSRTPTAAVAAILRPHVEEVTPVMGAPLPWFSGAAARLIALVLRRKCLGAHRASGIHASEAKSLPDPHVKGSCGRTSEKQSSYTL